jgi:hypothetical protein
VRRREAAQFLGAGFLFKPARFSFSGQTLGFHGGDLCSGQGFEMLAKVSNPFDVQAAQFGCLLKGLRDGQTAAQALGVEGADGQVMPATSARCVAEVEEPFALRRNPAGEHSGATVEGLVQPLVSLRRAGLHRQGRDGRHRLAPGVWLPFGCRFSLDASVVDADRKLSHFLM